MEIKSVHADPQAEEEGVWVDYIDDGRVKLARAGNKASLRAWEAAMRPHRQRVERGKMSMTEELAINVGVLAETVVLDWENFTLDGKDFPYSQENAKELLMKFQDFRDWVVDMSGAQETFFQKALADEKGNS